MVSLFIVLAIIAFWKQILLVIIALCVIYAILTTIT